MIMITAVNGEILLAKMFYRFSNISLGRPKDRVLATSRHRESLKIACLD